jgi:hypothetical protein
MAEKLLRPCGYYEIISHIAFFVVQKQNRFCNG